MKGEAEIATNRAEIHTNKMNHTQCRKQHSSLYQYWQSYNQHDKINSR